MSDPVTLDNIKLKFEDIKITGLTSRGWDGWWIACGIVIGAVILR